MNGLNQPASDELVEHTSVSAPIVSTRKPSTAAAASLLMPGLGHLYCGDLIGGLFWAVGGSAAALLSLYLLAEQKLSVAWIPSSVLMFAAAWNAWTIARKIPTQYQLKTWNRSYVYVLFLALSSFGSVGYAMIIRDRYVESFVIATNSMQPTLKKGDRILANKAVYHDSAVKIGDVIVFSGPEKPSLTFIKRVVALAGDNVQIVAGELRINGTAVASNIDAHTPDFGPFQVPRFNCFVLGDNSGDSKDSRHFGPIPLATVKGRVSVIFWPTFQRISNNAANQF